jgi:arginase
MPVAVSLGLGANELTTISGDQSHLQAANLVYIGLRSVDVGERDLIKKLNVRSYTMSDVDERGVGTVIRESLAYLEQQGVTHLHVSFDLDSIDPIYAPGVGTPVPGGLTYREAHLIMEAIAMSPVFHSLEIAEVNPILDNHNQSAELAVELIASSMGKRIL